MRKSRYTEEQIRLAVEQAQAGLDLTEICRRYGNSAPTVSVAKRHLTDSYRTPSSRALSPGRLS